VRIAIDAMALTGRDTGVGVWTRGLIGGLAACGAGHEYLVYHGADAGPALPVGGGVRAVPVRVRNRLRPLRIAWEQAALPRRLRRDAAEVLHCPSYVVPLGARLPIVLTLHDLLALTHPAYCTRRNVCHFGLMQGRSIRRAAAIHCTSQWTLETLRQEFGAAADRARVVHPCVDDLFGPDGPGPGDVRARWGLRQAPFLFVGRPEPKKGLPVLLRALARLRERGRLRRKLLMVGPPGWGEGAVRRLEDGLELGAHVVRAGYLPRGELPGVYRAARALVFPSLVEGFGLPPLEAMACGTPVVATHAGGLRESVGEAGLIVPPGDPEALADALERLETSGSLRGRLRAAGLARAARFRWREAVPRFLGLYEAAREAGPAV